MDALWSEFFSELLPARLQFLTTTPRNAKSRLRRYAILLLRSPMLRRFFIHFLGSTQSLLLLLPQLLPQLLPGCCRLPQKLLLVYAVGCHKNSSWCMRSILTACSFISVSCCTLSPVILAASAAKPPSFLCLFVELLLHFFLPQFVLYSKEDIKGEFASSHALLFCAPSRTI